MPWDTEGTRQKILSAAATEFARSGPDGTTVERIAKAAGVNKERIYNYFGSKAELFSKVLADQLATADIELPRDPTPDDIGDFAGRLYDYRRDHPDIARLLLWEGLAFGADGRGERSRTDYYHRTTATLAGAQLPGSTSGMQPDVLHFLLLSLAGYWAVVPQVASMITQDDAAEATEDARRRAGVVMAARALATFE